MDSQNMQEIIVKYLTRQTTLSERNELELWLENQDNYREFKEYVKINYLIDLSMDMFDSKESKKDLLAFIEKEKKRMKLRKYYNVIKYAAACILIVATVFHFYPKDSAPSAVVMTQSIDNVTLQYENGSIQVLDEKGNSKIIDANGNVLGFQKGVQLVYEKGNPIQKLVYNTINVPYGKHFKIKLTDGTVVNLNSGSTLKYPVKFIDGESRQVYLTGEAFFNVAKDIKHPFTVNADEVDVKVLGTQFNVSAYAEDEQINTVLVEGSVELYNKNSTKDSRAVTQLKPGYLGSWKKSTHKLTIEKTDTDIVTAWIEGRIIFKHLPFDEIIKKLERHYNVEIINNNRELSDDLITASFDIETIDQVFKVISEIHPITYKIEANKIIIYK
jgi:transmembrane sensor